MTAALGWGALAASSLVLGALLGIARRWPQVLIGLVLAFGAGALISAVSFDLAEEGLKLGGGGALALGLAAGALTYWGADHALPDGGGSALALGAFLDGIPEQAVLGIGLASGEGVGVGLLAAIFVSNLPEAIGSSVGHARPQGQDHRALARGRRRLHRGDHRRLRARGRRLEHAARRDRRLRRGRAAGDAQRLDDPDARTKGGAKAGLATVMGFAVAAGLTLA